MEPKLKDLPRIVAILKEDREPKFVVLKYSEYKKFVANLQLGGVLNEVAYTSRYPDVKQAIENYKVLNATVHYKRNGYMEQRSAEFLD